MFNGNTSIFWRLLRSLKLNGQDFKEEQSPTSSPDVFQPELSLELRIVFLDSPPSPYDVCVLPVWQSRTQVAWAQVILTIKPHSLGCSVPSNCWFYLASRGKRCFLLIWIQTIQLTISRVFKLNHSSIACFQHFCNSEYPFMWNLPEWNGRVFFLVVLRCSSTDGLSKAEAVSP